MIDAENQPSAFYAQRWAWNADPIVSGLLQLASIKCWYFADRASQYIYLSI